MTRQISITLTDEEIKTLPIEAQRDDDSIRSLIHKMLLYSLQWKELNKISEESNEEEEEDEEETEPTSCVFPVSGDRYAYQVSDEDYANIETYAKAHNDTPEALFRYWVEAARDRLKTWGPDGLREQVDRRIREAAQKGLFRNNAQPLVRTPGKGTHIKYVFYTSKEEHDTIEKYAQCRYETTATLFQAWLQEFADVIAMHQAFLEKRSRREARGEKLWANPLQPPETVSASESTQEEEETEEQREEAGDNV